MRPLLSIIAVCLAAVSMAQADSSLTKEFAGMSAKERNRLAKKEQEEARGDARFNAVMAEAEAHFQAQRYDEALEQYALARKLRPLNVYPKVKIQDLQALLAKRDAAAGSSAALEPVQPEAPRPEPEPVAPPEPKAEAPPSPRAIDPKPEREPKQAEQFRKPQPALHQSSSHEERVVQEDGIQERSYMEGRAVVLERVVTKNGLSVVYRKVTHPWGQVIHFRDGTAISEREWLEVFP